MTASDPKQPVRILRFHSLGRFSLMIVRSVLAAFIISVTSISAHAQMHIDVVFTPIIGDESDERKLYLLKQRPFNLWCELVSLDVDAIRQFVRTIDEGEVAIENTSVSFSIAGNETGVYFGRSIDRNDRAIEWVGQRLNNEAQIGYLAIMNADSVHAMIVGDAGVFRLHAPISTKSYILCKIDPDTPVRSFE